MLNEMGDVSVQHSNLTPKNRGVQGKTLPFAKGDVVQGDEVGGMAGPLARNALRQSPYRGPVEILAPLMQAAGRSATAKVPEPIMQLWGLLTGISFPSDRSNHGEFLQRFITGSGMMWENRLRSFVLSGDHMTNSLEELTAQDLKGLAMRILAEGLTNKSIPGETISRLVDSLEQLQLLNQSSLQSKGQLYFTIPVRFDEQFGFAELLVRLPNRGKGEGSETEDDKVLTASLMLEMSAIGPLRADVSLFKKAVRVGFLVCDETVPSLINDNAPALREQLERHGFHLQEIACRLQEANVLARTSLAEEFVDSEGCQIHLIV